MNKLTTQWCTDAGSDGFVLSGAGLWPLLALLAAAADGPARTELEAAVGVPASESKDAALRVLQLLDRSVDASAALGIWTSREVALYEDFVRSLPLGVVAPLTGSDELDEWARTHTGGRIERLPVRIDPDTLMVLATALTVGTTWRKQFDTTTLRPSDGPWRGRRLDGLYRDDGDLDNVAVLDGPVTRVVVEGKADFDVHLLIGGEDPAEVLGSGLAALNGTPPLRTGIDAGPEAPGLITYQEFDREPEDRLLFYVPPFHLRSAHDLLQHKALFGLRTATRDNRGHFPRLSSTPLYVSEGVQDVLASFTRTGFEAAAVTAFALRMTTSAPPDPTPCPPSTVVRVDFDRPFGFLAVHRDSGMAVVAGWVTDPVEKVQAGPGVPTTIGRVQPPAPEAPTAPPKRNWFKPWRSPQR